jgi:hypothetical protein
MKRLLFAAGLFLLASSVQAQMGHPANSDLDKDGKVTFAEFSKVQADGMLNRLDANKDGKIARDEGAGRGDRMWARRDADKDGFISRTELEAGSKRRFDAGDTNKDGWLSEDEILNLRQNRGRDGG